MQVKTNKSQTKTVHVSLAVLMLSVFMPALLSVLNSHSVINMNHQVLSMLMIVFGITGALSLLIGGVYAFSSMQDKQ